MPLHYTITIHIIKAFASEQRQANVYDMCSTRLHRLCCFHRADVLQQYSAFPTIVYILAAK